MEQTFERDSLNSLGASSAYSAPSDVKLKLEKPQHFACEVPQPAAQPAAKKPPTLRIVARMVMALRRWQNALNPTYTYGRPEHQGTQQALLTKAASYRAQSAPNGNAAGVRTASGRTASGRPMIPGVHHGFKSAILTRPLPEVHA